MKNRSLYRIEEYNDCCIIYRTDNNWGRQGVIFKNGNIRTEYPPASSKGIPQYIINECIKLLTKN